MKILVLALLLAVAFAQNAKEARIFTEEEMEEKKEFIGCHNLARVSSMNNYKELQKVDDDTGASPNEALLRYMVDIIYNCDKQLSSDQKLEMYEAYRRGEEFPDISHYPSEIFMDIEETLKTKEDLQIPSEQAAIHDRANEHGLKFRDTLEHFKKNRKFQQEEDSKGIHIMGININKIGSTAKFAYLAIIVLVLGYFFKLASGVLFKDDNLNPKHMPEKRRTRQDRKKKAKTT